MKQFIKWPGGKKQILNLILSKIPKTFNTYIEPFIGGGAIFFGLKYNNCIINDSNEQLINAYQQIKEHCDELITLVHSIDANHIGKETFYEYRKLFNNKILNNIKDIESAAMFIYLNKHCFNGLYRVNSKGEFNAPYNNSMVKSIDEANIREISSYLNSNNIKIFNDDFITITNYAKKDDFLFIDSPYDALETQKLTFNQYTPDKFSEEDHIRLANEVKRLDTLGCKLIVMNHDTKFVRKLYQGFNIEKIHVKRSINRIGTNRKGEELIITNY